MLHLSVETEKPKGWLVGPWNSSLSVSVGYANKGINERHFHSQMYEVYLVAKGKSIAVVNDKDLALEAGDVLVIEPGEVHTFVDSSADYLHFVINTPVVPGDKHIVE
jgi:quercetin dioxygenase-like cupin family protein